LAEVADEMGLVEVAGFEGDLHPVRLADGLGERGRLAETEDAAEVFRREAAGFETAAAEVAGAQVGLAGDPVEIGEAAGLDHGFNGSANRIWRCGGDGEECSHQAGSIGRGFELRPEFARTAAEEVFERYGAVG